MGLIKGYPTGSDITIVNTAIIILKNKKMENILKII